MARSCRDFAGCGKSFLTIECSVPWPGHWLIVPWRSRAMEAIVPDRSAGSHRRRSLGDAMTDTDGSTPEPPRNAVRRLLERVFWIVAAAMLVFALLRATGSDAHPVIVGLIGLTPFVMIPAWGLLGFGLSSRSLAMTVVAVVLVGAHVMWTLDDLSFGHSAPEQAGGLRLATGNLNIDNPTPKAFVATMINAEPDIILLQELTPQAWSQIEAMPELATYTDRVVDPRTTGLGSAILSRIPLTDGRAERFGVGWLTRADIVVGEERVTLLNVHLTTPLSRLGIERWQAEHEMLAEFVRTRTNPMILAGDFNATGQHDEFRQLLYAGLTDAHDATGSALGFSWGRAGVLLMRLDHMLMTEGLTPVKSRMADGSGSDHEIAIVECSLRR